MIVLVIILNRQPGGGPDPVLPRPPTGASSAPASLAQAGQAGLVTGPRHPERPSVHIVSSVLGRVRAEQVRQVRVRPGGSGPTVKQPPPAELELALLAARRAALSAPTIPAVRGRKGVGGWGWESDQVVSWTSWSTNS